MKFFFHAPVGGGRCFFRIAATLTSAQVGSVPIPPVMLHVRLLEAVVVLCCLVEEFRKHCDVRAWRSLPFAAGKLRRDFMEQPGIPVRIRERSKREVRTTL